MNNNDNFEWDDEFFEEPRGEFITVFQGIRVVKKQTDKGNKTSYVINTQVIDHIDNNPNFVGTQISIWFNGVVGRQQLTKTLAVMGINRDETPNPNVFAGELYLVVSIKDNEKNPQFPITQVVRKLSDEEVEELDLSVAF